MLAGGMAPIHRASTNFHLKPQFNSSTKPLSKEGLFNNPHQTSQSTAVLQWERKGKAESRKHQFIFHWNGSSLVSAA